MKKSIVALLLFPIFLYSCADGDPRNKLPQSGQFGETVNESEAITTEQLMDKMTGMTELKTTVSGTIDEYCKGEGCWLTLKNPKGEALFVEVENKAFVLPHQISGKEAVVSGTAMIDTTEEGKIEVVMMANGVLIK